MTIDAIKNGYVIDHIKAGRSMELYNYLGLDDMECTVAIIKNVPSRKIGKKDIIKIDSPIDIDLDILGYIDPGVTVNTVKDGVITGKCHLQLPEKITGAIKCRNPRCISSTEQELPQIFKLTDKENRVYRCIYCESKAKSQSR